MGKQLSLDIEALITDAELLLNKAVKEINVNIRDAAEKAWGATVRATDALILSRYGETPKSMKDRREKLDKLLLSEPELDKLGIWERLHSRESRLHVSAFYNGECEPTDVIKRKILETKDYIEDIKKTTFKKI